MKKVLFVFSLLCFTTHLFSQSNEKEVIDIKKRFKEQSLPLNVDCQDLVTDVNPGYELLSYIDTLPFYSDSTNLLTKKEFDYLFQSIDSLTGYNIWSLKECCKKSKDDFYDSFLMFPDCYFEVDKTIHAFIIMHADDDGIEKVLYTFDEDMRLIDKLPLAFYHRHGTYTMDDGGKGIWWSTKRAVINEDFTIKANAGDQQGFEILENGEIEAK